MNSEKEKALEEFIESGALATNMCPNFLRDAYFKHGFDAGVKAERERIVQLIKSKNYIQQSILNELFASEVSGEKDCN